VKPDGAAVYTTIPHGSYRFHVRASDGYGFWDRQGIVYRITQEPFFYETAAFQVLMIAAGGILLAGAYRFRLRQESARIKARLEERVAEREPSLVTCTTQYCRASRAHCSRFKLRGTSYQNGSMMRCRL
jgi:hypothetical protein